MLEHETSMAYQPTCLAFLYLFCSNFAPFGPIQRGAYTCIECAYCMASGLMQSFRWCPIDKTALLIAETRRIGSADAALRSTTVMTMRRGRSAVRVLCIVDLHCDWLLTVASCPDKPICQLIMCLWVLLFLDPIESSSFSQLDISPRYLSILCTIATRHYFTVVEDYYKRMFSSTCIQYKNMTHVHPQSRGMKSDDWWVVKQWATHLHHITFARMIFSRRQHYKQIESSDWLGWSIASLHSSRFASVNREWCQ